MRKRKICFFVPYYPLIKGGAEYQSKIIANELVNKGYEIIYISEGHEKETTIIDDAFKIHLVKANPTLSEKLGLYKSFMLKVNTIIAKERPDLIYQRILNTFTYRLSTFAHGNGIPFVLHIADNYSVEFGKSIKDSIRRKLFKTILAQKPIVICQTNYQSNKVKVMGHTPKIVMPNMHPVITEFVSEKKKNDILWIGNVRPVKQLELYLELALKFVDTQYTFHIIGNIPKNKYGEELLNKIESITNIIYHGSKDNAHINELLQTSGLLVNTSSSEGFSNTFIQSWLCGTPVLALNSDPGDTMKNHRIGIDCKGDYSQMPSALEQLLTSNDYDDICIKALETAKKLFSTAENIAKFEKVLEDVLL